MDAFRNRNRQADVPCLMARRRKAQAYSRSRIDGSDINRAKRSRLVTGLSRAATNASHLFWEITNSVWSAKTSSAFSWALESTKSVRFCPFILAPRSRKDFVSFDVRRSIRQSFAAAIGDIALLILIGGRTAQLVRTMYTHWRRMSTCIVHGERVAPWANFEAFMIADNACNSLIRKAYIGYGGKP